MTAFINVAIVTTLCLLVPALRLWGIVGVGILLYFEFSLTLGVLTVAGIIYFIYRRNFA